MEDRSFRSVYSSKANMNEDTTSDYCLECSGFVHNHDNYVKLVHYAEGDVFAVRPTNCVVYHTSCLEKRTNATVNQLFEIPEVLG